MVKEIKVEVPVERIVYQEVEVEKVVHKEVPVEKIVVQEKVVYIDKEVGSERGKSKEGERKGGKRRRRAWRERAVIRYGDTYRHSNDDTYRRNAWCRAHADALLLLCHKVFRPNPQPPPSPPS